MHENREIVESQKWGQCQTGQHGPQFFSGITAPSGYCLAPAPVQKKIDTKNIWATSIPILILSLKLLNIRAYKIEGGSPLKCMLLTEVARLSHRYTKCLAKKTCKKAIEKKNQKRHFVPARETDKSSNNRTSKNVIPKHHLHEETEMQMQVLYFLICIVNIINFNLAMQGVFTKDVLKVLHT